MYPRDRHRRLPVPPQQQQQQQTATSSGGIPQSLQAASTLTHGDGHHHHHHQQHHQQVSPLPQLSQAAHQQHTQQQHQAHQAAQQQAAQILQHHQQPHHQVSYDQLNALTYNPLPPQPATIFPPIPQTAIPDKFPNIQYALIAGKPYGEGPLLCIPIQYSLLSLLMLRKPGFSTAIQPSQNKLVYIVPYVDSAVFIHFLEWVYTGDYGPECYRMPRIPRHPLPNQTIVDGPQQFYDSPLNPWKHPMLCSHIDTTISEMHKSDAAWLALNISMAILSETWGLEKSHYPRSTSPSNTDGSVTIPDDISLAQLAKFKLAMQPVTLKTWVEVYIPTVYHLIGNADSCLRVYTRQFLDVEERLQMRSRISDAWLNPVTKPILKYYKEQYTLLEEDITLLFKETNEFPDMETPEGLLG